MKIKTKALPYEEVVCLPHPERRKPKKPSVLMRALMRAAGAGDLKAARFTYTTERMDALGDGPYLILMNHSSFIDLEIVARVFRDKPYCKLS